MLRLMKLSEISVSIHQPLQDWHRVWRTPEHQGTAPAASSSRGTDIQHFSLQHLTLITEIEPDLFILCLLPDLISITQLLNHLQSTSDNTPATQSRCQILTTNTHPTTPPQPPVVNTTLLSTTTTNLKAVVPTVIHHNSKDTRRMTKATVNKLTGHQRFNTTTHQRATALRSEQTPTVHLNTADSSTGKKEASTAHTTPATLKATQGISKSPPALPSSRVQLVDMTSSPQRRSTRARHARLRHPHRRRCLPPSSVQPVAISRRPQPSSGLPAPATAARGRRSQRALRSERARRRARAR